MRILVKLYFNELLGYLIMSFTSIPVIANDKNRPECIFYFFIVERFFNVETAIKRKKTIQSSNHTILTKLYGGNVYNRP